MTADYDGLIVYKKFTRKILDKDLFVANRVIKFTRVGCKNPNRCLRTSEFQECWKRESGEYFQEEDVEDVFNLQLERHRERTKGTMSLVGISHRNRSPGTMKYRHRRWRISFRPSIFFKGKHHGYRRPFNGITDLSKKKKRNSAALQPRCNCGCSKYLSGATTIYKRGSKKTD